MRWGSHVPCSQEASILLGDTDKKLIKRLIGNVIYNCEAYTDWKRKKGLQPAFLTLDCGCNSLARSKDFLFRPSGQRRVSKRDWWPRAFFNNLKWKKKKRHYGIILDLEKNSKDREFLYTLCSISSLVNTSWSQFLLLEKLTLVFS